MKSNVKHIKAKEAELNHTIRLIEIENERLSALVDYISMISGIELGGNSNGSDEETGS